MRVFIDTNVLIDFMANRQPYYQAAAALFALAEMNELQLVYSSVTVANSFYILRKSYNSTQLAEAFENQQSVAEIIGVSSSDIYSALSARWVDGEDCIQYQSALSAKCDYILTRNTQDFQLSTIPVMTPEDFLNRYYS